MSRTYIFGKFGSSIKFDEKSFGGVGGDIEPYKLIISMADNNPKDNFIIIGKNNLTKCLNLPKNIHDVAELYKEMVGDPTMIGGKLPVSYVYDYLKNIKIDGCFLMAGPTGSTNLLNFAYKRKPLKDNIKEFALTLQMHSLYSAPTYYFLNKTQIPWILINNDPRFCILGRDCLNLPKEILSQYNFKYDYRTIKSFEDQEELLITTKQFNYSGLEKIYLINSETKNKTNKTNKFVIILNEGNNGVKSRYLELIKFIGNDSVDIYGKWSNEKTLNDSRFKGSLKYLECQELLTSIKYTFIIPIKKGWVTMKFWEMLSNGIIPFFHPEYDDQGHLKVPTFLRVNNRTELKNRIQFLEDNPKAYKALLNELFKLIKPEDISGKTINDTIMNSINKYTIDNTNKIEFKVNVKENPFDMW